MEQLHLQDLVIFLVAAGLVVPLAKHWRLSPVLGFLLIGLIVGPWGVARFADRLPGLTWFSINDVEGVAILAEFGVIFLLFMIGLELSFDRLLQLRRMVFGLGMAQIVSCGLLITAVAWQFGNNLTAAVILGGALALSSTAIVIALLVEGNRFGTKVGRTAFAILLAQDLAVVPILFFVEAAKSGTGHPTGGTFAIALVQAIATIVGLVVIGRFAIRPLFRFVGATRSPELFMATVLLAIIGTAAATHLAGLSAALGAFLAGLLLAETEYRHEIELNIEPFKGLLLGVFFMSVGMGVDLGQVLENPIWIVASIVGLIAIKASAIAGLARLFGLSWREGSELGLLLAQGGEFAFVIVGVAATGALLPSETAQFMLIVVSGTLMLSPALAALSMRIGTSTKPAASAAQFNPDNTTQELLADMEQLRDHTIIVGYGRTGERMAELLSTQQRTHIGLDLNPARVVDLQQRGVPVVLGDASRRAMLDKLEFERAAAMIICTDDPGATERVLATARALSTSIPIIVRAKDESHATSLLRDGASIVIPELLETGLQLGVALLTALGLPNKTARELVHIERLQAHHRLNESTRDESSTAIDAS